MSDRCVTHTKKFSYLFIEYRKQVVPLTLRDEAWEKLSEEQQKQKNSKC